MTEEFKPIFYPEASVYTDLGCQVGGFPEYYPRGCVIHYTAGAGWESSAHALRAKRLGYHFMITRAGRIIQLQKLDERVDHAGKSYWNGHLPNSEFIGIALCSYGLLKEKLDGLYFAWPGDWSYQVFEKDRPIEQRKGFNGELDWWEGTTEDQEVALIELLRWLIVDCKLSIDNICGHDECSGDRKIDPGGVLPWSMAELRDSLDELVMGDLLNDKLSNLFDNTLKPEEEPKKKPKLFWYAFALFVPIFAAIGAWYFASEIHPGF